MEVPAGPRRQYAMPPRRGISDLAEVGPVLVAGIIKPIPLWRERALAEIGVSAVRHAVLLQPFDIGVAALAEAAQGIRAQCIPFGREIFEGLLGRVVESGFLLVSCA